MMQWELLLKAGAEMGVGNREQRDVPKIREEVRNP